MEKLIQTLTMAIFRYQSFLLGLAILVIFLCLARIDDMKRARHGKV